MMRTTSASKLTVKQLADAPRLRKRLLWLAEFKVVVLVDPQLQVDKVEVFRHRGRGGAVQEVIVGQLLLEL